MSTAEVSCLEIDSSNVVDSTLVDSGAVIYEVPYNMRRKRWESDAVDRAYKRSQGQVKYEAKKFRAAEQQRTIRYTGIEILDDGTEQEMIIAAFHHDDRIAEVQQQELARLAIIEQIAEARELQRLIQLDPARAYACAWVRYCFALADDSAA